MACDPQWADVFNGNLPEQCAIACEAPPIYDGEACGTNEVFCGRGSFTFDDGVRGCCAALFDEPIVEFYACDD